MKGTIKRFLSLTLAILMVISLMPTNFAFATDAEGAATVIFDNSEAQWSEVWVTWLAPAGEGMAMQTAKLYDEGNGLWGGNYWSGTPMLWFGPAANDMTLGIGEDFGNLKPDSVYSYVPASDTITVYLNAGTMEDYGWGCFTLTYDNAGLPKEPQNAFPFYTEDNFLEYDEEGNRIFYYTIPNNAAYGIFSENNIIDGPKTEWLDLSGKDGYTYVLATGEWVEPASEPEGGEGETPDTPAEDVAVSVPETLKDNEVAQELAGNTAVTESGAVQNVPEGAVLSITVGTVEMNDGQINKLVFDVKPLDENDQVVQPEVGAPVTFRLPIPEALTGSVEVYHKGTLVDIAAIQGTGSGKYIVVTVESFSEFAVVPAETDFNFTDATTNEAGAGYTWDQASKTLTLSGAAITEAVVLPAGSEIVVTEDTENSVTVTSGNAIYSEGNITITGTGELTVEAPLDSKDSRAICSLTAITVTDTKLNAKAECALAAPAVSITSAEVDLYGYYYAIHAKTTTGTADSVVTLTEVSGTIAAYGYGGINAHSETANVLVTLSGCENLEIYNEVSNDSTSANFNYAGIRAYTRGSGKRAVVTVNGCSNASISNSTMGIVAASNANKADEAAAVAQVFIIDSEITLSGNTSCYSAVFVNNYGLEEDDVSSLDIENSQVVVNAPNGSGLMTSTKSAPSHVNIEGSELTITAGLSGIRTIASSDAYAQTSVTASEITFKGDLKGNPVDESVVGSVIPSTDYYDESCTIVVDGPAFIVDGKKYATLYDAVTAAEEGGTVTMLHDASGAGVVIDKDITIDFGGNTYTVTQCVGSTGTRSNGLQLLKGNDIVLCNGTLLMDASVSSEAYILVQNYANLTLQGMTLNGKNLDKWSGTDGDSYTLSLNHGTVVIEDTTIIANTQGAKAFAFDVYQGSGYDSGAKVTIKSGSFQGNFEVASDKDVSLSIQGGSFTMKPEKTWLAPGFAAELSNGVYTVVDKAVSGTITENMTWEEGTLVKGVTIAGDVTITVSGKVYVGGTIRLTPDAICNVTFKGINGAVLVRDASFTGQMFYVEGASGNFQNLTFQDITLDGGAVWTGETDATLGRGTTNSGVKASGSVLYLVYANATLNKSVLQNHDDASGEKANAVFLRYYSTITFVDSVVRNNNSVSGYYRGGVITVRQGGTVTTRNSQIYGNKGVKGGFFGTSSTGSYGGVVEAYDSTFHHNYADNGAVFDMQCNSNRGYLLIDGCTFYENTSNRGVIYEHSYSRPVIIKDSVFRDNDSAIWDCHADPVLDLSGKIVIEGGDYNGYLFETPLVISGPLAAGSSIEMSAASLAKLSGCFVTGADGYTVTQDDLAKFDLPEGYEVALVDVNGDGFADAVALKPEEGETLTQVTLTLKDSADAAASATATVYSDLECLPVNPFAHEGLAFTGWTDEDGDPVSKQVFTESVTLVASWKVVTPTVKLSRDGATLMATVTNASEAVSYTYQWYMDNVAISGATKATYTMTDVNSHSYKCEVTASVEGLAPVTVSASATSSAPAVVKIGETGYATVKAAVDAANTMEGDVTITLAGNVTVTEEVTVKKNITITGAYTITRDNNYVGTLFTVDNDAKLTLDGGVVIDGANEWSFDEEGFETALANKTKHTGFAFVTSQQGAPQASSPMFMVNGSVVMNQATIRNHMSAASGINSVFYLKANSGASVTMNNGAKVTHCATANSSTVASVNEKTTFTINEGAEISDNYGAGNGAMARNDHGTINMTGGLIKNNRSVNANGSVFMMYGVSGRRAVFNLSGGEICSNIGLMGSGASHAPAIHMHQCSDLVMTGGTVCHNTGFTSGGLIAFDQNSSTLTISGGAVIHNNAKNYPDFGDLYAMPKSCNITGGIFTAPGIAELVAPGYMVNKLPDGTYGVLEAKLEGSGTQTDPYLINNARDLLLFRDSVNAGETKYNAPGVYVALNADIDMAGATWERGIGDGINATFDGIFDGQNHTIKNLNLAPEADSDGYLCGGLFGYTCGAAVIKNLVLENITVTSDDEGHNVGILVGFANNNGGKLNVTNVTVKDSTINTPNVYGVGAIVGYSYRSMGTIEDCSVEGVTITGYSFVGGITGYSYDSAVITGCSVTGSGITATSKGAGGIAGLALGGSQITGNTVADTTVTAATNWGYVLGEMAAEGIVVESNTAAQPQVGGSYSTGEAVEARIGSKYYTTLEAALEAAKEGDTITLLKGIVVEAGQTLTLDKAVTIEYTSAIAGEDMFTNNGTLIVDGAKLVYVNTDATGINVTVSTISCAPGSVLEVKSGSVENRTVKADGSSIYSYAIDILTNGSLGDITATVSGGTVYSDYMAIRQFNNGAACKNTLNVTGGYIYGAKRGIQVHFMNNAAYTTITGGKVEAGDYALCFLTDSENLSVEGGEFIGAVWYSGADGFISGGIFDESVEEDYCADGYIPVNNGDGTYGVKADPTYGKVAMIGETYYATLAEAVEAAGQVEGGATVTLIKDITLGEKISVTGDVTIAGEYTITRDTAYTGTLFTVNAGAVLTLDGGLVIDGNNNWTLNEELYNQALNREITGVTWAELITSEEGKPNATAPMFLVNGSVVANDVTIQNNYSSMGSNNGDYGVFKVEANATLTMTGATVKHIVTGGANSVAHLSTNAVWTINDGTLITDTFAGKNGGICRNDSGKLIMNGGVIEKNRGINTNGTVVMLYKGSMEMNGGKICGNSGISGSANGRCAPIYGHSTSTFIMTGGEICHNTGISYGGVDVPSSIKVEISGGYVGENISALGNPNADINGNANTVITGGIFTQDVSAWLAPDCRIEQLPDGTYSVEAIKVYEVATKDELKQAVAEAQDGEIIRLTADIDYGTDHLELTEAVTLDLGGHTLTTRARNYGIAMKGGCSVINGKLNHAGTVAAIKVWDAAEISDLEIDVTGTSSSGNAIDGIVLQQDCAGVDKIENVTIHSTSGQGIAKGIETYNCGNATEPVIGSMENVTIDAKTTGMSISAPCGTATNCSINGGVTGIEIWIKGTYSATLDLVDCDVTGGEQAVFAHDEFSSNPSVVNNGKLLLTADADTTFGGDGVLLNKVVARAEDVTVPAVLTEGTVAILGTADGGKYYTTFEAALEAAEEGDTITLLTDVKLTGKFTVAKGITIDGNGHSIIADETAVWYTVSGKLNIKNYKTHLLGINADNITLKNITLDCNNNAAGINVYCAQGVTFDNVSIINATKGVAALTVNGSTLTVKTAFTALGNSVAMDISNGSGVTSAPGVTVEDGTVFDLGDKTVKFASVAVNHMTGAVDAEGNPYFAAMDNAYFYTDTQIATRTTTFSNGLTLLVDLELSTDLKIKGILNMNGCELTMAQGKVVKIEGVATLAGECDAPFVLNSKTATLTAPEGLDVTTSVANYVAAYKDGKYIVVLPVAEVSGEYFATLQDAVDAAEAGETVKLLSNIALADGVVIAAGDEIVLELNGFTISRDTSASVSTATITNNGKLTVCDSVGGGKITAFAANPDTADVPYYANNTITNCGELIIKGGIIENYTGDNARAAFPIDNNSTVRDAVVTIEGGEIVGRGAIRQFANSTKNANTVTVTGGKVTGSSYAVWVQNPGSGDPKAALSVTGGELSKILLSPSSNFTASITGGTIAEVVIWEADETDTSRNPSGFISGGAFTEAGKNATSEDMLAYGYIVSETANAQGNYEVVVTLPDAEVTDIKGSLTNEDPDLTFALNFSIKDMDKFTDAYIADLMEAYGSHYTDYVLTISGLTDSEVVFNANGDVDGYLAGQYDAWSSAWVTVPFEDVTIQDGDSLYIMAYAAELMGKTGLRFTLAEVAEIVQSFDCGVYFTPEFLAANPNMKITLELVVYNDSESFIVAKNEFASADIVAAIFTEDGQTQYFATVQDAVDAVADGQTICLLANVEENVSIANTTKLSVGEFTLKGKFTVADGADFAILSGTFDDMDAKAYVADGKVGVDNGDGTWTVGEAVAVNTTTGVYYTTAAEGLAQAKSGETVQLISDSAEGGMILVGEGITLDLNGKTLTAAYLVAFGDGRVIDAPNQGAGKLVISKNRAAFSMSNTMLPLWNGVDGYVFSDFGFVRAPAVLEKDGVYKVYFRVLPNAAVAELLKNGASDNLISIVIDVSWDNTMSTNGTPKQQFVYSDVTISQVYTGNNGIATSDWAFYFEITGLENLTNVVIRPVVVAGCGAQDICGGTWTINP